MKKYTLLSLFLCVNICIVCGQKNTDSLQVIYGPAIEFEKMIHDFGDLLDGECLHYSYSFKNPGSYPLIIHRITSSCGCVVIANSPKTIKPGESATIDVIYDSSGKGQQYGRAESKRITVSSNAIGTYGNYSYLNFKGKVYTETPKIMINNNTYASNAITQLFPVPVRNTDGPVLEFENPIYDWGEIMSGDSVTHSYSFKNIGSEIKNSHFYKCRFFRDLFDNHRRNIHREIWTNNQV